VSTKRVGIIIPSSNRMVEQEMVQAFPRGVQPHVTRLRMTGPNRGPLDAVMPVGDNRPVLCTDPHVTVDPNLLPLDDVIAAADLLIIAAPHAEYATLETDKPVADIWNLLGKGVQV